MTRLLATAVLATLLAGCGSHAMPQATAVAGRPLAVRAVKGFHDLGGSPVSLSSLTGHAVVVSFLAPGSHDSEAEVPLLLRLSAAYAAEGVRFVMGGERADAAALSAFAASHDLTFPVWEDRGGSEWKSRGFDAVPAHEFRRADGSVSYARQGFMSRGELTEQLEALVR